MLAVIENKDFIEAVFPNTEEAEAYLREHPQKDACVLKEMKFSEFPFYFAEVAEKGTERIIYLATKEELLNYMQNVNTDNIGRTYTVHAEGNMVNIFTKEKAVVRTSCPNAKEEGIIEEELHFTIYKIHEPYNCHSKDKMGMLDHAHISEEMINEAKNGNTNSIWKASNWQEFKMEEKDG